MKLRTITHDELELDDPGTFELSYQGADKDSVVIKKEDNVVKIGYLVHDEDCQSPFEYEGGGRILRNDRAVDRTEIAKLLKAGSHHIKLSAYIHSGEHWSIQNSATHRSYPDQQWDVAQFAGVWVPDKECLASVRPDYTLEQMCQGVLDEYNAWLEGDCWGVCVDTFELDSHERVEDDACWGYIGRKYAEEELKGRMG